MGMLVVRVERLHQFEFHTDAAVQSFATGKAILCTECERRELIRVQRIPH